MINSSIYNGQVIHKRFKPKVHYFKYNVFSLLIDLSELDQLDKKINLFLTFFLIFLQRRKQLILIPNILILKMYRFLKVYKL